MHSIVRLPVTCAALRDGDRCDPLVLRFAALVVLIQSNTVSGMETNDSSGSLLAGSVEQQVGVFKVQLARVSQMASRTMSHYPGSTLRMEPHVGLVR